MKKIISLVSVAVLSVLVSNIAQAVDCADDEVENKGVCKKKQGECALFGQAANCRYTLDENRNVFVYSSDGNDVSLNSWGYFYNVNIGMNNLILSEKISEIQGGALANSGTPNIFCVKGSSICDGTNINNKPTYQYEIDEENEGNIKIYNTDGTELQGVYKNWNNAFEDKVVDSYSTTDSVTGIQTTYNGRGQILSQIKRNDDGSRTIYDSENNIIGFKGKRIYTVEEASLVTKPTDNTFKIRYK